MKITPERQKRLQEVGRALSETHVPLKFSGTGIPAALSGAGGDPCVILEPQIPWAANEAQEWIFLSARRDHEYAHARYSTWSAWEHFKRWAENEQADFERDRGRGFPSAAFAVDIFNLIEDARVERAWAREYPGTAARTRYYHRQRAQNSSLRAGAEAIVAALYDAAVLGEIPGRLSLSAEEADLIGKARRTLEKGKAVSTTHEVHDYAINVLMLFREYLLGQVEPYGQQIPDPAAAGIPAAVPLTADQSLSTPGQRNKSEPEKDGGESSEKDPFKNEAEEEYRQLYMGAEKELREASLKDARTRWIAGKQAEARRLEKGIHERIVVVELDPAELERYYGGDTETLTPACEIRRVFRKQIMDLSREIREALLYKRTLPERRLRRGWPDTSNLWKLSIGETDVFRRKSVEAAKPDLAVMLLADCSRSLRKNRRSELCKQSLVIAAEALKGNRVKYAIEGFTTGVEYNTVVQIKFKSFEQNGVDNLDHYSGFRENRDGYSIRKAALKLAGRPEQRKVLIVLSDSVPNHTHVDRAGANYSFELGKATKDTVAAVRETMRKGILVVGIFIGDHADADRVRPIYPNFVCCDAANLPRVLGGVLRRCLRRV